MSSTKGCKSSSSSSSSSSSLVCEKVKCKRKCKEISVGCVECPAYCPEAIVQLKRAAVVTIQSEFILTAGLSTGALVSGATNSVTGGAGRQDVFLNGSGFMVKGHYILAPAHLVLIPPTLSGVVNRYPFFNYQGTLPTATMFNTMTRASRILVTVYQVNNRKESFVYEADLIGVDGSSDVALLKINHAKQFNRCSPRIEKCHPFFKIGKSRATKDGEKVFLMGDYVTSSLDIRGHHSDGAISEGIVSDHRFVDPTGNISAELVLVSAPAYSFSSGLPIINGQAEVIGMQTCDLSVVSPRLNITTADLPVTVQSTGIGLVAGPSTYFMKHAIKRFLKAECDDKNWKNNVVNIKDPVGAYYALNKGYLGIGYNVLTGFDYDVTADFGIASTAGQAVGLPKVRLDSNGNFYMNPSCKQIVGIRILALAGQSNTTVVTAGVGTSATNTAGAYFVPGTNNPSGATFLPITTTTPGGAFPDSPLAGILNPGDVIVNLDKCELGNLKKQVCPALVLQRLRGGDNVRIYFRRGGNAQGSSIPTGQNTHYENINEQQVEISQYPLGLDYPWYSVNIFPLASSYGFGFPANQSSFPQLPQGATDVITGTFVTPV